MRSSRASQREARLPAETSRVTRPQFEPVWKKPGRGLQADLSRAGVNPYIKLKQGKLVATFLYATNIPVAKNEHLTCNAFFIIHMFNLSIECMQCTTKHLHSSHTMLSTKLGTLLSMYYRHNFDTLSLHGVLYC